ncbi:MAG: HigA family addiction module antitoxin [Planctomycetota bacterium]|nr:HigA family addiction module antitoxin [Planctomycetota bacterium]
MTRGKGNRTTTYPYAPDYAVPPGRTLQETIDALGLDQRELAQRTGLSAKHVNQVVKGVASITPDTAIRLERVTGVPAHMWNNLEANYREQLARLAEKPRIEQDLYWLETIPTKELVSRGKLAPHSDPAALFEQVLRFFGVANLAAWKEGWESPQFAFRKSRAFAGQTGAFEVRCQPYSKSRFVDALQATRGLTVSEPKDFVPAMIDRCAAAGVAVVLIPEIKGAPVSGAAKWITARKAMIGLNLRGKSNDRFWFSFFHEAGHLLLDSKKQAYIDVDSGTDPHETAANRFAADFLIPTGRAAELRHLTTFAAVQSFAQSLDIAPGIVVDRLQHEGLIAYNQFNGLKVWLKWSSETNP